MLLQLIFLDPLSFHVFVPVATPSAYLSVLQPFQFYSKVGLLCLDPPGGISHWGLLFQLAA